MGVLVIELWWVARRDFLMFGRNPWILPPARRWDTPTKHGRWVIRWLSGGNFQVVMENDPVNFPVVIGPVLETVTLRQTLITSRAAAKINYTRLAALAPAQTTTIDARLSSHTVPAVSTVRSLTVRQWEYNIGGCVSIDLSGPDWLSHAFVTELGFQGLWAGG